MGCRCADIEKLNNDIRILGEIAAKAAILPGYDDVIVSALDHIAVCSDASFFTREGFSTKVRTQNKNSSSDITSLIGKISSLETQLQNELSAAQAEDDAYVH